MSDYSRDGYDEQVTDVPKYVLVGTNFHNSEDRAYTTRFTIADDSKTFPENVTLGFRSNFWRVFSSITEYDRSDFKFEWLGRSWIFVSFWLADSSNVDFATYLDEPINAFLIFILKPLYTDRHIPIRQLIFESGLNEQTGVDALINGFRAQPYYGFLRVFHHKLDLNGLFTWTTSSEPVSIPSAVAFFSFYSFCLLMIWKLAREQTYINIAVDNNDFQRQLHAVLRTRSQIINVERYFLTQNISNDRQTNLVARDIRDRFGLQEKFNRFLPLNESIERHLKTALQMRADLKSTILNLIVFSAAAIGLPLAVMSMLLTFSPNSYVIEKGGMILVQKDSLLFFLGTTLSSLGLAGVLSFVAFHVIRRIR